MANNITLLSDYINKYSNNTFSTACLSSNKNSIKSDIFYSYTKLDEAVSIWIINNGNTFTSKCNICKNKLLFENSICCYNKTICKYCHDNVVLNSNKDKSKIVYLKGVLLNDNTIVSSINNNKYYFLIDKQYDILTPINFTILRQYEIYLFCHGKKYKIF